MPQDNVKSFIIPLSTRTITSMFDIGQLPPQTRCPLEVKVESHVEKSNGGPPNLYIVETVVCCYNNEYGFRVLVGLETAIFAHGTLEQISETIRHTIREDIFDKAEQAIYRITSVHSCPLKIYLNKYVKENEQEDL